MQKLKGLQSISKNANNIGDTVGKDNNVYNLLDFQSYDWITVEHIAATLSKQCRYVGNTFHFYSIAQHSVDGAKALLLQGKPQAAYDFLFHDASESFTGDISRPLKLLIEDKFDGIEDNINMVLSKIFGFEYPLKPEVKLMDKNLAQYEMSILMSGGVDKSNYWSPEKAESSWLEMYNIIQEFLSYEEKQILESSQNGFDNI